ncbi:MAG: glycosyltransferase [Bacteroidetes bacterium]|nr:glycosyltransferase [Bacteroidota bacterium]
MKDLCIFTYSFPYGKSEEFLYPEIFKLSKYYKTIHLFPLTNHGSTINRVLPENIVVHEFKQEKPVKSAAFYRQYASLILKAFNDELLNGAHFFKHLSNFKYYLAHFTNACYQAECLNNYLEKKQILNSVFYSYWFNDWVYYLSILKYKKKISNLITRIHGGDVYEYQHSEKNFFFPFRNFQVKQLDKIAAISEDGREHLKKHYPASEKKIIVCRLGTSDHGNGILLKKEEAFTLVSCSTFFPYKNVALIPKIISCLKFKVNWIHFGEGGPDKERVEELIKTLPQNIKVEFKGYTEQKDLFEFYRNNYIDLFINTSISEGLPVSLMEAISFSIPVMAPNVGGIKELVNPTTGILFTHKQKTEELADRITALHNASLKFNRADIRNFWELNFSEKNYLNFHTAILCAA